MQQCVLKTIFATSSTSQLTPLYCTHPVTQQLPTHLLSHSTLYIQTYIHTHKHTHSTSCVSRTIQPHRSHNADLTTSKGEELAELQQHFSYIADAECAYFKAMQYYNRAILVLIYSAWHCRTCGARSTTNGLCEGSHRKEGMSTHAHVHV